MNKLNVSVALLVIVSSLLLQMPASAQTVRCAMPAEKYHHPPSDGLTNAYMIGSNRYIYQRFRWNTALRHAWLTQNEDSTFELDTLFYNYDRKAFAKSFSGSWSSNLPGKYIDTQAFDRENEKAVTIGSAKANNIVTNKTYYYFGRMEHDGHRVNVYPSSSLKVLSQYGRRVPNWCYSAACSFGCESNNNNIRVLEFNQFRAAPNCKKWIMDLNGNSTVQNC